MRHSHYLLVLLLCMCFGAQARTTVINETDHYYCGFDTEEEFAQWTKTDLNGTDDSGNSDVWWDGDWKAAMFNPGISQPNDEWLVSPAVTLTGGKSYAIKFKMYVDYPGKLSFAMGQGVLPSDMTTIISETQSYDGGDYYLRIAIPEEVVAGTYHFGIHCTTGGWDGPVYIQSFEVTDAQDVDFSGSIADNEAGKAVPGARVRLSASTYKEQEREANEQGLFSFEHLSPGTYTITISQEGFNTLSQEVEITEATASQAFCLEKKKVATLTGRVVDEATRAVKNVRVSLEGSKLYEATTDENGRFLIPDVIRLEEYTLRVKHNWKEDYEALINAQDTEIDLGDVVLKTYVAAPQAIRGDIVDAGALVSWQMPTRKAEFALDNGTYGGTYQFTGGDYNRVGNVFHGSMVIEGMRWLLSSESEADKTVDLYLYALDRNGALTNEILLQVDGVPNKNYAFDGHVAWNEYRFEQPIVAPYGCIAAVGCNGSISVCSDYADKGCSVVMQNEHFRTSNAGTFFIRAYGSELASDPLPAESTAAKAIRCTATTSPTRAIAAIDEAAPTYTVYRLKASDEQNRDNWTKIEEGISLMSYVDRSFHTLSPSIYKYAILATYADGKTSATAMTEEMPTNIHTNVTMHVYTNTAIDFSKGATVTLTNDNDNSITYQARVSNGAASFPKVLKGPYTATVAKAGFAQATLEGNDFSANSAYEVGVELQLIPQKPFSLRAEQHEGGVTLGWNTAEGICEGFEDMDNFEVNPAGDAGWSYADMDGEATYGISRCQSTPYPNMYAPMAFMAFAPDATTPSVIDLLQPHGGKKMLVDVALANGGQNDDYVFSPELTFNNDFTFSFHAAAGFYAALGEEEFMVGYTTSAPTPENVIWLTEKPQTVGGVWTEFAYDMPKEARHAVIRCVSNQHMFFMVDDVFIGTKEAETFAMTTFNVYLDEEELGTTSSRSFELGCLSQGRHLAKVQTVYPMYDGSKRYSDFAELLFRVDGTTGITSATGEMLFSYQNGIITAGSTVDQLSLYDAQGRQAAQCKGNETIATRPLRPGVYVLRMTECGHTTYAKILVR